MPFVRVITNPNDGPSNNVPFDYLVGPKGVKYLQPEYVQLMRDYVSGTTQTLSSGQMGIVSALLSYVV